MVPSDLPRELVEMQVYTPTSDAWKSLICSCILVLYSLVLSSITMYLSLIMIHNVRRRLVTVLMMGSEGGSISFYHQLVKLVSGGQ